MCIKNRRLNILSVTIKDNQYQGIW